MADLLVAGDSEMPNAVSMYLRETLPQEYTVVSDLTVRGCRLDAVVVGPPGLVALRVARTAAPGVFDEAPVCDGVRALQQFMAEEYPALRPSLRQFTVEPDPASPLPLWRAVADGGRPAGDSLAETITAADSLPDPALADERVRDELAMALRDRRLSTSQRTSRPFVFRSSRLLGLSVQAWSVREAVAYMDGHPDDGIHHLINGTLENWLREEGAPHLAKLAHDATFEGKNDRRRALEIFLVGTGLVARPRLALPDKRIELGYVLNGAPITGRLRLQQGRGRGYLAGTVSGSEPWLRLAPKEFAGRSTDIIVMVDTSELPIVTDPVCVDVLVHSNASAKPIHVPLQFHFATRPPRLNRVILRPFVAMLFAGWVGLIIGGLFALAGVPAPVTGDGKLASNDTLFWLMSIGLMWALLGVLRGAKQPIGWPIHYATERWLKRSATWMFCLAVFAVIAVWGWSHEGGLPLVAAALGGLAAAVVPATIGELQAARALDNPALLTGRRQALSSLVRTAAGVLMVLAILAAPRLVVPTVETLRQNETVQTTQHYVAGNWQRLSDAVGGIVDQLYLRYYDRRAPAEPASALQGQAPQ